MVYFISLSYIVKDTLVPNRFASFSAQHLNTFWHLYIHLSVKEYTICITTQFCFGSGITNSHTARGYSQLFETKGSCMAVDSIPLYLVCLYRSNLIIFHVRFHESALAQRLT